MDPFLAKEEDVEYLQAEDELMDIKSNSLLKRFFAEHGCKRFWLVKGLGVAPKLALRATTRFILLFVITYLSETAFSALVTVKTKAWCAQWLLFGYHQNQIWHPITGSRNEGSELSLKARLLGLLKRVYDSEIKRKSQYGQNCVPKNTKKKSFDHWSRDHWNWSW